MPIKPETREKKEIARKIPGAVDPADDLDELLREIRERMRELRRLLRRG